ncbi:DctP family TRAP transporter solute-binding subunit [Salinisphaera aquimarina]|uniref:DctP family TRAP transporter solute-binding subunit n=1 Tax=Salinisphaera aquimarina TaxID=2094031 RepID=A0ABV7EK68_9GAMM
MSKQWTTVLIAASLALTLVSAPALAFKSQYKMSMVVGPNTAWGMGAQRFADLVKERTDGKINIKVYYSGALFAGKQTNEFTLLRQGVADFSLASTINWSPQVKELNLFSLPFFFPDHASLDAVVQGKAGDQIFARLDRLGVKPLAWGENGFRQLTNSRHEIAAPADLADLKIRVVGSKLFIDTFQALGANPTAMPYSEALTALQQGVVDGQENPVGGVIVPYKLWQYSQKYLTVWNYVVDPLIYAVNGREWKAFSPEIKKVLLQSAQDAARYQKALARVGLDDGAALAYLKEQHEAPDVTDPYGVLEKNGVTVTRLDADQLAAFKKKVAPVVDKWTDTIGADLVDTARTDQKQAQ